MRRIGKALGFLVVLLAAPSVFGDEIEFYQTVDRNEVGTDEAVRLTVTSVNAPSSADVQLPSSPDFEVLSQSQNSQTSFQFGGSNSVLRRIHQYVLVLRPNRAGRIVIPPAVMIADKRTYKSEAIDLVVRKGHVPDPNGSRAQKGGRSPDPFRRFPFPGFSDDEDFNFPEERVPRGESDLFMRAAVDKDQVFVGEQVLLSLYIFSRIDLSSVDAVSMPKLDGFWSEDLESPQQLQSEQRVINGIPYRAYLLKRRALFPVRTGAISIGPTEADITTGFLFAGHRLHRVSNEVTVKVKALPPGAPPGMNNISVGQWQLSAEASQTRLELGQPVTVKVILEGQGNLKNIALPPLSIPPGLRAFDPTTTDKIASSRSRFRGRRTLEYLITAQRTGTFAIPPLELRYFNPESERYEVTRTDPISLVVVPASGGSLAAGVAPGAPSGPKNVLSGGGLKPLRYRADLAARPESLARRPLFLSAVLVPPGLWLGLLIFGLVRGRLALEDDHSRTKKKMRAARARLGVAQKLAKSGSANEFYGEVEKALIGFLEGKLGVPVGGLTRDSLRRLMDERNVDRGRQQAVLQMFEECDSGRYAPGTVGSDRRAILEKVAELIGGWSN